MTILYNSNLLLGTGFHLEKVTKNDGIQSYVSNLDIKWTFIVELAAQMDDFYKRLVGLVRRVLLKTITRNLLTYVQLQTLLKEVVASIDQGRSLL